MTGGTASRVPVRGGVTGGGGEGSRPRPVPLRSLEKIGPTPHTPTAVPVPARTMTDRPTPTVVPVPRSDTRRVVEPVRVGVGGPSVPKNTGGAEVPTVGVRTPPRPVPASVTASERPVPVPPVVIGTTGWDYDPPDFHDTVRPLTESDVRG